MRQLSALLLLLLLLAGAVVGVGAQSASLDYPQWRGRERDGSASAFVLPKVWPEQLTKRWKVEVGEGYATPILVGSVVYVFTRLDGAEGITALDADSGRQKWRSTYPAPYTPSQPTAAHGAGAKATPLFHEGRLFTLGISGIVTAFDAATRAHVRDVHLTEQRHHGPSDDRKAAPELQTAFSATRAGEALSRAIRKKGLRRYH